MKRMQRAVMMTVLAVILMAGAAWAETTGDVTWDGGAGAGSPGWDVDANWVGDEAPTNPTPGTVYFSTSGQAVVGRVEADRQIDSLETLDQNLAMSHTIDLGANTLTVTNRVDVRGSANVPRGITFTNGTLRLTDGATLYAHMCNLTLGADSLLDARNLALLRSSAVLSRSTIMDLRGAVLTDNRLTTRTCYVTGGRGDYARIYINAAMGIDRFEVTHAFTLGDAFQDNKNTYIGDPGDTFTVATPDGNKTFGKFPAGIDLVIGEWGVQRASMLIARDTYPNNGCFVALRVAPGGGGSFTGYIGALNIAIATYSNTQSQWRPWGIFNLAEMDACTVDIETLAIAPGHPNPTYRHTVDDYHGELWLPTGVATVGTATVGASYGVGYGLLSLSNTAVTVTNALTLNLTGEIEINMGGTPTGLDIEQGFTDAGGAITVNFLAAPSVATNWAVRIAGDAQTALNAMIGDTRLTATGTFPGKDVGVLYDGTYTYYAMADSDAFTTLPIAIAHDERTYEMDAGGSVVLATNDINNGSYDPADRPFTLAISDGGGFASSVTLTTTGDHTITLKITAGEDEATDTCTVHVVDVQGGATDDVTWLGDASTDLMNRREWFWSGNWVGGAPPTNPTAATLTFAASGQDITGLLAADRQINRLQVLQGAVAVDHTIDLGEHTLSVTNELFFTSGGGDSRLTFTNGTFSLGDDDAPTTLIIDRADLVLGPDARLQASLDTLSLPTGLSRNALLDLRGTEVVGGTLDARIVSLTPARGYGSRILLNDATAIDSIRVRETLSVGSGMSAGNNPLYIGNSGDTFLLDDRTLGQLPAGIDLLVGVNEAQRANVTLGNITVADDNKGYAAIRVAPGGGGSFTGYIGSLRIGTASAGYNDGKAVKPRGMLHLAEMDSCLLDVLTLSIATARAAAEVTDDHQGELWLGPGTATVGTAVIGADAPLGLGRLSLSNTVCTVTNALTLNKTAEVRIQVGTTTGGLELTNPTPGALALDPEATIAVSFHATPSHAGLHYGLRLAGDHVTALTDMLTAGRLTIDSTGLLKPAGIFRQLGATYVGIPPPAGSLFLLR